MNRVHFVFISGLFSVMACGEKQEDPLLKLIPAEDSGINFVNQVEENDTFNILSHEFMYNGGGVGVGDFNGDGLPDLYFTGNEVPNKLYLNRSDSRGLRFEDVTESAGVAAAGIWSSGVAVVDINNDDRPDIYVSATFRDDPRQRTNQLFINQGNDGSGIPLFSEEALRYGLADTSHTTQTYFFDYDNDGDLDAFLLNDKLFSPRSTTDLKQLMLGGEATIDKLYQNDGRGKFVDVSEKAGIVHPGFGLGAALLDINSDGFLDIYVSNDFISNDLLYVNLGDGRFENRIGQYFKHHSFSSMGIDVADLNGDGREDVMTLDMLPENEARVKRTYAFHKYKFYDLMKETGYAMQYNRNTLQLSSEAGRYSDVSALVGVDATEWSWSILFADLDNDGRQDIAITNGYPRDITDMDFTDYNQGIGSMMASKSELLDQIPVVKVRNYFFQNQGKLKFSDKSEEWGIDMPSFSNGAAVADLDNDGDLDYVVNNINDPVHLYENQVQHLSARHYLRLKLQGTSANRQAIGAKVQVYWNGQHATALNTPQRGYLSSTDPVLHFGLGKCERIDSIRIYWPDRSVSILKDIAVDQVIEIDEHQMAKSPGPGAGKEKIENPLFVRDSLLGLLFKHREVKFYDFDFQALLPRMHSREGPGIAVGDLNGDGQEDLVLGNGSRSKTHVFLSHIDGTFSKRILEDISLSEDMGLLIFDPDLDGDNDLYIASGSTEFKNGSKYYYDKFYENEGNGNLILASERIPEIPYSAASVSAADYDQDGDLDLFLAGRLEPQRYPAATSSFLLQNDNGRFVEVNRTVAPGLENLGMVSQGLWTDFDQDGWVDLIVVGEWMPIQLFRNENGKLSSVRSISDSEGWWNSITGADLDQDGDVDYVLGNQGWNNKTEVSPEHPLYIYAHDFDQNGSIDPIITAYKEGGYYPVHLKMDLLNQLNVLKKKFLKYEDYARARIEDIIHPDTLRKAARHRAVTFASAILWNDSSGFRLEALPVEAQFAPVYGSLCEDFDWDGDPDILLVGNRYNTEVFEGRHDALNGLLLINDGRGSFSAGPAGNRGFEVDDDARSLVQYFDPQGTAYLIAGINDDFPKIFKRTPVGGREIATPRSDEYLAVLHRRTGGVQVRELYYGSSFLSQSSRRFFVDPALIESVDFYNFKGEVRSVRFSNNES